MTISNAPQATISPRPLAFPLGQGFRAFLRLLPAPLISEVGPGRKPVLEGGGRSGFNFFCLGALRQKVGGRCAQNWWIVRVIAAKSLIVEWYCLIKSSVFSIICASASINYLVLSIVTFLAARPFFSLFLFCKQGGGREKRGPSVGCGNPSIQLAAYFLIHQFDFAFLATDGCSGSWKPCAATVSGLFHQNPSIHQCFAPPSLKRCFL